MVKYLEKINKEYLYLGILVVFLFFLNAFDKFRPGLEWERGIFLINYLLAALFINYYLLPRFFYKKRIWGFIILLVLVIVIVVLVEEFILEKLVWANTMRAEKIRLSVTLFEALPPILFLVAYKISWDAIQKQNKIEALNRMVAESELQFLNSQINPHFLFNNLNNLYAYALDNSPKTPGIILQLSSILRYMLYDCKDKVVPLGKELENLNDYIKLSKLQLEDEGLVSFNVEGIAASLKIAPLILMVFVENAFKHGPSSLIENVQISISIKINENTLYFNCENNYGELSNTENLSKGIGLKNAVGRLDLSYPDKYVLNIDRKDNCYKVFLKLELTDD